MQGITKNMICFLGYVWRYLFEFSVVFVFSASQLCEKNTKVGIKVRIQPRGTGSHLCNAYHRIEMFHVASCDSFNLSRLKSYRYTIFPKSTV